MSSHRADDAAREAVIAAVTTQEAVPTPGPVTSAVALRASLDDLDALTPAERSLLGEWLDRVVAAPREHFPS